MALLFCDGMDAYASAAEITDKWSTAVSAAFSSSGGRFGGGAISGTSSGSNFIKNSVGVSFSNTFQCGFWFKTTTGLPGGGPNGGALTGLAAIPNSNTTAGTLMAAQAGTGILQLLKAGTNGNTVLGTGSRMVYDGNWHWAELQYVFSSTTSGSATLYIDGTLEISVTGVATMTAGATANGSVALGNGTNGGGNGLTTYDDFIVWDNTGSNYNSFPIGPRRIGTLNPNGAGASTQFTPSTAPNYSCESQAYSGSAYVQDAGTGNTDLYTTAGLTYTPASTVNAVVVNTYTQNPSGDGTKSLSAKLRSGASPAVASGTSRVLTAAVTNYQDTFYTDATSAAWTATTVNSAQLGIGD